MFEGDGFNRHLLTAIGYADTQPVLPNRDKDGIAIPTNQSQNRRVIIRLLKEADRKVANAPAATHSASPTQRPKK